MGDQALAILELKRVHAIYSWEATAIEYIDRWGISAVARDYLAVLS
jgi:hypothetical protein